MPRRPLVAAAAGLAVAAMVLVGWYGYRASGFRVDLWNALLLCGV